MGGWWIGVSGLALSCKKMFIKRLRGLLHCQLNVNSFAATWFQVLYFWVRGVFRISGYRLRLEVLEGLGGFRLGNLSFRIPGSRSWIS